MIKNYQNVSNYTHFYIGVCRKYPGPLPWPFLLCKHQFQGHRCACRGLTLFLWRWRCGFYAFGSLDTVRRVTRKRGGLAPQMLGVRPRRQPDLRHFAPPSCRLDYSEVLTPVPLFAPLPAHLPRPCSGLGVAPVPHGRLSPIPSRIRTHPNCAATCGGACSPRSTAGSGPRSTGQPGLRLRAAGSGSRCPPRPRGRTHPGSGSGP